jgi:hypothetical protein
MVSDFVQESVKQLFNRPATVDAIVGVDPYEAARAIVASEHAPGGSSADVDRKLDPTVMNPLEPVEEKWSQSRNGRLKSFGRRRRGKPGRRTGERAFLAARPRAETFAVTICPGALRHRLRMFVHESFRLDRVSGPHRASAPGQQPTGLSKVGSGSVNT